MKNIPMNEFDAVSAKLSVDMDEQFELLIQEAKEENDNE